MNIRFVPQALVADSWLVRALEAQARARGVDDACTPPADVAPPIHGTPPTGGSPRPGARVTPESRPLRDARHESHVTQRDAAVTVPRDTPTLSRTCPQDVPDLSRGTADGQPEEARHFPPENARPSTEQAPPPGRNSAAGFDVPLWNSGAVNGWQVRPIVTPERVRTLRQRYAVSLRASLDESLSPTLNHESTTMNSNPFDTTRTIPDSMSQQEVRALNAAFDAGKVTAVPTGQVLRVPKSAAGPTAAQVQALSGALDAAGKIHAQAFGSDTIRGLIDQLAKCQHALAGFLPKGDPADIAPAAASSEALASPCQAPGQQIGAETRHNTPHAVNTLVAGAYRATREHLGMLQATRDELSLEMARQRERLLDLQEHFGSEEDAMRAMQTYLEPRP